MIFRLEVENFYSVRELQVIDLTVGKKVPNEEGRLVQLFDESLERAPNVVAIYGANASGKSNVLRIIPFLSWFVSYSFQHPANNELPYQKFQTLSSLSAPTKLRMSFSGAEEPLALEGSKSCPYIYSVEFSPRDGGGDRVLAESLFYRPSTATRMTRIFERDEQGNVKINSKLGIGRELSTLEKILRPEVSVISTLGQLNNALAQRFIASAQTIQTNILVTRIEGNDLNLLHEYAEQSDLLTALNRDIRRIDLGVDQVRILARNGAPVATFNHTGLDHPIEMPLESHGTQQFVRIYPRLYNVLQSGGIAVVDELDASIHPSVLPEIIRWFADPHRNPHGAQLWMSCHSVSLLDELLKEEVLICEKNSDGATHVYGLKDIKGIRRDEKFLPNYLGGVYGGVPSIG